MPYVKALLVALVSVTTTSAHAACKVDSAPTRPHLVELYSSEGCSSCPPAEGWLRTLRLGADVVPLEFHVDYWDSLGWRDRFSSARYTARQNDQARRDGGTSIFTPQVVLDGRNWSGWYRGGHLSPLEAGDLALHMRVETGKTLHVDLSASEISSRRPDDLRTYVALIEDGLETQVRAGENRGVLLRHDHVVRAFSGAQALAHATVDLAVPSDENPANSTLVAFAQDKRDGRVAQVVTLPLAQCLK